MDAGGDHRRRSDGVGRAGEPTMGRDGRDASMVRTLTRGAQDSWRLLACDRGSQAEVSLYDDGLIRELAARIMSRYESLDSTLLVLDAAKKPHSRSRDFYGRLLDPSGAPTEQFVSFGSEILVEWAEEALEESAVSRAGTPHNTDPAFDVLSVYGDEESELAVVSVKATESNATARAAEAVRKLGRLHDSAYDAELMARLRLMKDKGLLPPGADVEGLFLGPRIYRVSVVHADPADRSNLATRFSALVPGPTRSRSARLMRLAEWKRFWSAVAEVVHAQLVDDFRSVATPLALASRASIWGAIEGAQESLLRAALEPGTAGLPDLESPSTLRRYALWLDNATDDEALTDSERESMLHVAAHVYELAGELSPSDPEPALNIFRPPLGDYLRSALLGARTGYSAQSSWIAGRLCTQLEAFRPAIGSGEGALHVEAALAVVRFLARDHRDAYAHAGRSERLAVELASSSRDPVALRSVDFSSGDCASRGQGKYRSAHGDSRCDRRR